jgi:excisionase family DNA binding protein
MKSEAPNGLPALLNTRQVAAYLQLHEVTVLGFARKGKLPGFKVGREWRFRMSDIQAWVEERQRGQAAFGQRFDALWERLRRRAEGSGYGQEDVSRLVRDVRESRGSRRTASRA